MKTLSGLPLTRSEASRVVRRRNRRKGRPGRSSLIPFLRPARKLSETLQAYTVTIEEEKHGLAQCPCCEELVSVFVRHRGQLLCRDCAGDHVA